MSKRIKMTVAAIFAAAALGGVAPAATAENHLQRDVDRIYNRDVNRIANRDVGRVVDFTADTTGDTARFAARTLRNIVNPR